MSIPLNRTDIVTLSLYFALLIIVAIATRSRSLETYWANDRRTGLVLLSLSTVATSVGSGMVFGIVAMSYLGGSVTLYLGVFNFLGLIVAGIFAHRIKQMGDSNQLYSLPDLLGTVFSARCRLVAALVNILVYFFFLSAQLLALAAICGHVMGIPHGMALPIGLAILVLYTFIGGLRTDIIGDALQFILIIVLIICIMFPLRAAEIAAGGVLSLPSTMLNGTGYGGVSFLVGLFLFFTPVPLVMMDVWMRIFSASSPAVARKGLFLSAFIILPIFAAFTYFGLAAHLTIPHTDPNTLTTTLIAKYLPTGLRGIALAGLLAAIMTTADSMLIISSLTLVRDIFSGKRTALDHGRTLRLARLVGILVAILAMAFAVLVPSIVQVIVSAFSVLMILLPSVIAALFRPKTSEAAVFWSIVAGLLVTAVFLPLAPTQAFIPGVVLSLLVFFGVDVVSRRRMAGQSGAANA